MVHDLRTDSSDYRTELLSPPPAGEELVVAIEPSWRLNMDRFHLPADHNMDSHFGFGYLIRNLRKQRKLAGYYKRQEKILKGYNEVDTFTELGVLPGILTEDEMEQLARSERVAIYASNVANLVLFVAKVYASVESKSLAVIASTLDSLLDLLSGFILWFTAYAMKNPNQYQYPIGKNRMQPVVSLVSSSKHIQLATQGIVVFASVMTTLGLQILFESGRELVIQAQPDRDPEKEKWMIGIMVSVTAVKFVLMMYYCSVYNGKLGEYSDGECVVVDREDGTIRVLGKADLYNFGCQYFVEVDIVLPGEMSLSEAHNIGETLQEKLEQLSEVERAFVHVDFNATHQIEHKPKKT
ncbi:hypothetical protein Ddye_014270 [Dipteronia dyeriana]|uniref:Cation efflux protein cytoplasmic domain-containing protein n=1 Tax=Dipteronia dyeriana TaxID=168575 RepID=A0AAE0CKG0_9ROSI|nr:hypothetical protein Ddye_014270 [Dipteronia dyeriana]